MDVADVQGEVGGHDSEGAVGAGVDADVWFVGDNPIMPVGFSVIEKGPAGEVIRNEENFPHFITKVEDFHPSAWDPHRRAKVMEEYGVDSAVLYPNLGFIGPDIYRVIEGSSLEFQVEIASTYNDWIRDWSARSRTGSSALPASRTGTFPRPWPRSSVAPKTVTTGT